MCGGDACITLLGAYLFKETIALVASSLLYRDAMAGGIADSVEFGYMQRNTVAVGKATYKRFVAVAIARTQMEVAMGNGKPVASLGDKVTQGHRIASSAYGKEHRLPWGKEVLLFNMVYKAFVQCVTVIVSEPFCASSVCRPFRYRSSIHPTRVSLVRM